MVHFPSITTSSVSTKSFVPICIGLGVVAGIALLILKQWSSTLGFAQSRTNNLLGNRIENGSHFAPPTLQEGASGSGNLTLHNSDVQKQYNINVKKICDNFSRTIPFAGTVQEFIQLTKNYRVVINHRSYTSSDIEKNPDTLFGDNSLVLLLHINNPQACSSCPEHLTKRIGEQNSSTKHLSPVFNPHFNPSPDMITGAKLSIMDPFAGRQCFVKLGSGQCLILHASSYRELIEKVGLRRGMNTTNFILIIGGKRCNGDEDFNGAASLECIHCVDRRPSYELLKTLNLYYKDEKPYNQEDVEEIEGCITNGYQRALRGKKCEIQTETLDAYQHYLSNIKTNLQNRAQVEDFSTDYEKEQADSYLDGLIRTIDAIPRLQAIPLKEIVREQLDEFASPFLSPECLNDSSTTIKVKIKTPGNPETECELNRKFLCAHSTLLSGILECRNPNESEPLPLHGIFMDPKLLGFFQSGELDLKTLSVDQILNVWVCADSFGVDYVLKMCWEELFERANSDSLSKEEWPGKEDSRYRRLPECFYELLAVSGITESLPD